MVLWDRCTNGTLWVGVWHCNTTPPPRGDRQIVSSICRNTIECPFFRDWRPSKPCLFGSYPPATTVSSNSDPGHDEKTLRRQRPRRVFCFSIVSITRCRDMTGTISKCLRYHYEYFGLSAALFLPNRSPLNR